MNTKHQ